MRSASILVLSLITACAQSPAEPGGDPVESGRRYISIGADALDTARGVAEFEIGRAHV